VLSKANWDGLLKIVLIRLIDDAVGYAKPVCGSVPCWLAVEAACKQAREAILSGDEAATNAAYAAAKAAIFTFVLDQIELKVRSRTV
jgi:hypothetical protein